VRFSWRARRPEPVEPAARDHGSPLEWNLWELERRARAHTGPDVPHEWAAMFRSLREVARSDGRLPTEFDALVRESFPELTQVAT
jgi:hypothetical protein